NDCASPTQISAPHERGGASTASESGSATTQILTASSASSGSASIAPKKFGDCTMTAAYFLPASFSLRFARLVAPVGRYSSSSIATSSPSQYVFSTAR